MNMPEEVRNLCRLATFPLSHCWCRWLGQASPEKMTALVEKIAREGATRQQLREVTSKPKPGRPKAYVFAYRPPTKAFNLRLRFTRPEWTGTRLSRPGSHHRRVAFGEAIARGGPAAPRTGAQAFRGHLGSLVNITYIIRPIE